MGVREFEPFYCAARAKYSRPQAMVHAIDTFLFDIYCAIGVRGQRQIEKGAYVNQLYEEYRLKNYSHEEAWLRCERIIIDGAQQAFIAQELSLGYSKNEAYDLYKWRVRSLEGRCPVLEQYREILTPDTPDSRPDPRSRYDRKRQKGGKFYARDFQNNTAPNASTRPSGYRRPQGSYANPPTSGYTCPPPTSGRSGPRSEFRYGPPPTSGYTRPPPPEYAPPPRRPPPASETSSPVCLYKILGISRSATADDIKQAHRKLMLKWHPDRNHGNEAEATAQTKIINQARDVLSDPGKKMLYDCTGRSS